ncbi:MAG: hypothetical protein WBQ60_00615 [Asticcacaulis sp.]
MSEGKCAIWGTDATLVHGGKPYHQTYDSPRSGGKYEVSNPLISDINNLSVEQKARLTSWLIEERLNGNEIPDISSHIIQKILFNKNISTSKRIENFLLYCLYKKVRIGNAIIRYSTQSGVSVSDPSILAWTESIDTQDYIRFEKFLIQSNYIDDGTLTLKAYSEIESLERENVDSKQAFVAMWFDPSNAYIFDKAIMPAIEDARPASGIIFTARKIDNKEHNNKIDDEIIAEIKKSRFVIADFTSDIVEYKDKKQALSRGGVYYEAGFAQGLGLQVIWTCKAGFEDLIHFDVRQYNTIFWNDEKDLYARLKKRIEATIT